MNKKIIALIIGLLLILLGLFCLHNLNKENNLDEQVLEDVTQIKTERENIPTEENITEEITVNEIIKPRAERPAVNNTKTIVTKDSNTQNGETVTVLKESVVENKEFEDPYVEDDGTIVVKNEFRPALKENIFFRGAWYNIKTRLAKPMEQ